MLVDLTTKRTRVANEKRSCDCPAVDRKSSRHDNALCYPSGVKRSWFGVGLIFLVLLACRSPSDPAPSGDAPGEPQHAAQAAAQFDFYLLNLSWSPEFCHSHPAAAECAMH